MQSQPNSDPQAMVNWHTQQLQRLFPDTIRNGFWLPSTQRTSRKIKDALGFSVKTKYEKEDSAQSIDLFSKTSQHRDIFIKLCRDFKDGPHSSVRETELRNQIREAAVNALQGFHDHGNVHIQKFYDRNLSVRERSLAYRRWTRTIDYAMDIYAKLPPITGDNFVQLIKDAEDAQVQVRTDAISELINCDPRITFTQEQFQLGYYNQDTLDRALSETRVRITAEMMLHSIKTINPQRTNPEAWENREISPFELIKDSGGGTIDIGGLSSYSANNTTYNCTRVVPATVGVVFGAKLKAVAAIDDREADKDIRAEWMHSYESAYGGKFSPVRNFYELYDALEASPPGTTGIIYNSWAGTVGAHVSVVANIGGVPCMVEGQTATMIMRNPQTRQFEAHSLDQNKVIISPYDPKSLLNIKVLMVEPEKVLTEHQRATKVIEKLHEKFFEKNDATREIPIVEPRKQYYVGPPNETSRLKGSPNMLPGPPGPIPSRNPFSPPAPPMIGPPPQR